MEKNLKIGSVGSGVSMIRNIVCRKKVLIVFDNVDESTELEKLVGEHHWFSFGSKIIITTRNQHALTRYGITHIYEVEELGEDDAIELFKSKAFGKQQQMEDYGELVHHAITYAKGVPLALKVLGKNKNDVTKILDSCGFHPIIGIDVLVKKSLVTISDNKLMMHDLIQELGWYIVCQKSPKEPGECSRLWLQEDLTRVLMENTGTKNVEGIAMDYPDLGHQDPKDVGLKELKLRPKAFAKMSNLKILKMCYLKYLSNKLRYLDWCRYPMKCMPSTFQPERLVELHLTYSSIEQLWEGTMPHLGILRIMNLSVQVWLIFIHPLEFFEGLFAST
ncbi:hypothetical protein CsSME_00026026 [Camellia sinensis var. sinensis]